MEPQTVIDAARARARHLELPRAPDDVVLERLRTECAAWFAQVPEPPVYRRADDPVRRAAGALIPGGQELLARCLAVARHERARAATAPLIEALQAHLTTLVHTTEGRLEAAEQAWHRALEVEQAIGKANRLWVRTDERTRAVFDSKTGASRYDPGDEPSMLVKLICPARSCHHQERYRISPRYATHRFVCPRCSKVFIGTLGEVRAVTVVRGTGAWRYRFELAELGGALTQVEFDDKSGAEFNAARRDLLAFLHDKDRELKGVLNLSSGRVLWVHGGKPCFLVTAVYGEQASELAAFRAFRDQVLAAHPMGRALVRGYYAVGPKLAWWVKGSPLARAGARHILGQVHRWLVKRGFR
jgi:hypothetical protein